VALQGNRWFLGQIYGYKEVGLHFGVPLSNYIGWWIVSLVLVFALQRIDARVGRNREKPAGVANLPFRSLLGPLLYLSVLVFNYVVTISIGEQLMALTGILMFTLPVIIVVVQVVRRANRYSRDELAEHLKDYPYMMTCGERTR